MSTKFSQISPGATPLLTDQILGLHAGTTDNLFTVAQIQNAIMAGSNPFTFDSRSVATANTIPPLPQATVIQTRGYTNPGDGGAAIYSRAPGSTVGGFQSADGQWWQIVPTQQLNVMQFGATGNGPPTDDAPAINAASLYAQQNKIAVLEFPAGGTFYVKSSTIWVRNNLTWEGNGATIYTDQVYPTLRLGMFGNQAQDTMVLVGELTADFVGPSDKLILNSVTGLSVGDYVGIRLGTDPYQTVECRFATIAQVIAIVGTTITIDRVIPFSIPIVSSYIYMPLNGKAAISVAPANTDAGNATNVGNRSVYRFPNKDYAVNVTIRNFNLLGSSSVAIAGGFAIQWGYNIILEDIVVNNDGVARDMGIGHTYMQFCRDCRLIRPILGWHANISGGPSTGSGFSFPECINIRVENHVTRNVWSNIGHTESWSDGIVFSGGTDIINKDYCSPSFFGYGIVCSHVTLHNMTVITNATAPQFSVYVFDDGEDSFVSITGVFIWRGPMAEILSLREWMHCIFDYDNPADGAVRVDFQSRDRQSVKIPLSPNMSNAVFQLNPSPIVQLDIYCSQNVDPTTVTSLLIDGDNTYATSLHPGQVTNISGSNLLSFNSAIGTDGKGYSALVGLQSNAGQVRVFTSAAAQAPGNFIIVSALSAKVLEAGKPNIFTAGGATPTSIFGANIVAWYKADTGVTGTNPITAWADQSGNGHDLTVYNGAPKLASTGFNGFPGIVFAETNLDGLQTATFNVGVNVSAFFIVANIDTSIGNRRVVSYFEQTIGDDFSVPFGIAAILNPFPTGIAVYQNSINTFTPTNNAILVPAFSNARIGTIYNGPGGTVTQLLGTSVSTVTSGFGNNTLGSANTRLTVGYNDTGGGSPGAAMTVAEILWVKTIPTQQQLNDLDYYFTNKYKLVNNMLGNNLLYALSDAGADDLFVAQRVPVNGGTFVANGATAVTVSNINVAITDVIMFSLNTVGGTVGALPTVKTITAGTGFTVAATAGDTSIYNYAIIKNS